MYIGFIVLFAAALGFLIYASVSIQSGIYLKALCKGSSKGKLVALTFDDGPDPVQTPKVLDVLNRNNIKAAFFCIGMKAEQYPDIVARIVKEGHIVGNHTYSHDAMFPLFGKAAMVEELERTTAILGKITNDRVLFFRPPFGITNPNVGASVRRSGLTAVGWSIRSFDTVKRFSREHVLNRIERKLHNGGIILMHDDRAESEILLESVVKMVKSKGYDFKRIDEL